MRVRALFASFTPPSAAMLQPHDQQLADLLREKGVVAASEIDNAVRQVEAGLMPDLAAAIRSAGMVSEETLRTVIGDLPDTPKPPNEHAPMLAATRGASVRPFPSPVKQSGTQQQPVQKISTRIKSSGGTDVTNNTDKPRRRAPAPPSAGSEPISVSRPSTGSYEPGDLGAPASGEVPAVTTKSGRVVGAQTGERSDPFAESNVIRDLPGSEQPPTAADNSPTRAYDRDEDADPFAESAILRPGTSPKLPTRSFQSPSTPVPVAPVEGVVDGDVDDDADPFAESQILRPGTTPKIDTKHYTRPRSDSVFGQPPATMDGTDPGEARRRRAGVSTPSADTEADPPRRKPSTSVDPFADTFSGARYESEFATNSLQAAGAVPHADAASAADESASAKLPGEDSLTPSRVYGATQAVQPYSASAADDAAGATDGATKVDDADLPMADLAGGPAAAGAALAASPGTSEFDSQLYSATQGVTPFKAELARTAGDANESLGVELVGEASELPAEARLAQPSDRVESVTSKLRREETKAVASDRAGTASIAHASDRKPAVSASVASGRETGKFGDDLYAATGAHEPISADNLPSALADLDDGANREPALADGDGDPSRAAPGGPEPLRGEGSSSNIYGATQAVTPFKVGGTGPIDVGGVRAAFGGNGDAQSVAPSTMPADDTPLTPTPHDTQTAAAYAGNPDTANAGAGSADEPGVDTMMGISPELEEELARAYDEGELGRTGVNLNAEAAGVVSSHDDGTMRDAVPASDTSMPSAFARSDYKTGEFDSEIYRATQSVEPHSAGKIDPKSETVDAPLSAFERAKADGPTSAELAASRLTSPTRHDEDEHGDTQRVADSPIVVKADKKVDGVATRMLGEISDSNELDSALYHATQAVSPFQPNLDSGDDPSLAEAAAAASGIVNAPPGASASSANVGTTSQVGSDSMGGATRSELDWGGKWKKSPETDLHKPAVARTDRFGTPRQTGSLPPAEAQPVTPEMEAWLSQSQDHTEPEADTMSVAPFVYESEESAQLATIPDALASADLLSSDGEGGPPLKPGFARITTPIPALPEELRKRIEASWKEAEEAADDRDRDAPVSDAVARVRGAAPLGDIDKHGGAIDDALAAAAADAPEVVEDFGDPNAVRKPSGRRPSMGLKAEIEAKPKTPTARLSGARLGPVKLIGLLDEATVGTLYEGKHTSLPIGRLAVHVLPRRLSDDSGYLSAFGDSALAAARLTHKHIPLVIECTHDPKADRMFLISELPDGKTLQMRLTETAPLRLSHAIEMTEQLLAAIEHAHGVSLIHGEIAPKHIVLQPQGDIKLGGFGVLRRHPTGSFLDDPLLDMRWAAPELFQGQALSAQTDLYALGVTLYRILAGRMPFGAEPEQFATVEGRIEFSELLMETTPAAPHVLVPDVDADLSKFAMRLLAKEPGQRYTSATAAREGLIRLDIYSKRKAPGTKSVLLKSLLNAGDTAQLRGGATSALRGAAGAATIIAGGKTRLGKTGPMSQTASEITGGAKSGPAVFAGRAGDGGGGPATNDTAVVDSRDIGSDTIAGTPALEGSHIRINLGGDVDAAIAAAMETGPMAPSPPAVGSGAHAGHAADDADDDDVREAVVAAPDDPDGAALADAERLASPMYSAEVGEASARMPLPLGTREFSTPKDESPLIDASATIVGGPPGFDDDPIDELAADAPSAMDAHGQASDGVSALASAPLDDVLDEDDLAAATQRGGQVGLDGAISPLAMPSYGPTQGGASPDSSIGGLYDNAKTFVPPSLDAVDVLVPSYQEPDSASRPQSRAPDSDYGPTAADLLVQEFGGQRASTDPSYPAAPQPDGTFVPGAIDQDHVDAAMRDAQAPGVGEPNSVRGQISAMTEGAGYQTGVGFEVPPGEFVFFGGDDGGAKTRVPPTAESDAQPPPVSAVVPDLRTPPPGGDGKGIGVDWFADTKMRVKPSRIGADSHGEGKLVKSETDDRAVVAHGGGGRIVAFDKDLVAGVESSPSRGRQVLAPGGGVADVASAPQVGAASSPERHSRLGPAKSVIVPEGGEATGSTSRSGRASAVGSGSGIGFARQVDTGDAGPMLVADPTTLAKVDVRAYTRETPSRLWYLVAPIGLLLTAVVAAVIAMTAFEQTPQPATYLPEDIAGYVSIDGGFEDLFDRMRAGAPWEGPDVHGRRVEAWESDLKSALVRTLGRAQTEHIDSLVAAVEHIDIALYNTTRARLVTDESGGADETVGDAASPLPYASALEVDCVVFLRLRDPSVLAPLIERVRGTATTPAAEGEIYRLPTDTDGLPFEAVTVLDRRVLVLAMNAGRLIEVVQARTTPLPRTLADTDGFKQWRAADNGSPVRAYGNAGLLRETLLGFAGPAQPAVAAILGSALDGAGAVSVRNDSSRSNGAVLTVDAANATALRDLPLEFSPELTLLRAVPLQVETVIALKATSAYDFLTWLDAAEHVIGPDAYALLREMPVRMEQRGLNPKSAFEAVANGEFVYFTAIESQGTGASEPCYLFGIRDREEAYAFMTKLFPPIGAADVSGQGTNSVLVHTDADRLKWAVSATMAVIAPSGSNQLELALQALTGSSLTTDPNFRTGFDELGYSPGLLLAVDPLARHRAVSRDPDPAHEPLKACLKSSWRLLLGVQRDGERIDVAANLRLEDLLAGALIASGETRIFPKRPDRGNAGTGTGGNQPDNNADGNNTDDNNAPSNNTPDNNTPPTNGTNNAANGNGATTPFNQIRPGMENPYPGRELTEPPSISVIAVANRNHRNEDWIVKYLLPGRDQYAYATIGSNVVDELGISFRLTYITNTVSGTSHPTPYVWFEHVDSGQPTVPLRATLPVLTAPAFNIGLIQRVRDTYWIKVFNENYRLKDAAGDLKDTISEGWLSYRFVQVTPRGPGQYTVHLAPVIKRADDTTLEITDPKLWIRIEHTQR